MKEKKCEEKNKKKKKTKKGEEKNIWRLVSI